MKAYRVVWFICLYVICFLADYPAYCLSLKSDNEQIELYLKKLQSDVLEEEKAVESLKKRYEDISREKQKSKERKDREKESKKPGALQSEMAVAEVKLEDLEPTRHSLKQKNQELLNSLEQSVTSIQEKNKTIEELRKNQSSPPKEETINRKVRQEVDYSKKEDVLRKQLDKLRAEKVSLKGQIKYLKEENKNLLAREPVQPRPAKEITEIQKREIRENTLSGESVDSKGLDNSRVLRVGLSQHEEPGILKGFIGKAKKLDSWWRKKVW